MDAVKYLKERARLCDNVGDGCGDCPLREMDCHNIDGSTHAEQKVKIVEEWSKEHPVKTRMSEFLKQYPNADINLIDKFPRVDPCTLDNSIKKRLCKNDFSFSCSECREKYWLEEITPEMSDKALERDAFNFSQGQSTENDDKKVYVCDRNKYKSLESVDKNTVYFVVHTAPEETKKG